MTQKKDQIVLAAKNRPCMDCGRRFHPSAMEFDHLPQFKKRFEVGHWAQYSRKAIHAEIAKCEVVCSNCHRVRTWVRHHPEDAWMRDRIDRSGIKKDGEPEAILTQRGLR